MLILCAPGATPILLRGAKTQLTLDNLDPISDDLDCIALWDHGKVQWEKELARGGKHPLIWTLLKAFPSTVLAPLLPCVIFCACGILSMESRT